MSAVFQEHLDRLRKSSAAISGAGRSSIVGCGKAHFLEHLQKGGFDVTGLDPTYEGTNPAVRMEFFTPEGGSRADGLILWHVLEHIPAPVEFLRMLRDTNGGSDGFISGCRASTGYARTVHGSTSSTSI